MYDTSHCSLHKSACHKSSSAFALNSLRYLLRTGRGISPHLRSRIFSQVGGHMTGCPPNSAVEMTFLACGFAATPQSARPGFTLPSAPLLDPMPSPLLTSYLTGALQLHIWGLPTSSVSARRLVTATA
ncbi:hypothetical protein CGRA01v4_06975 [Colletotrichum graminicola]|nr:hypothetical protein CGRA01v4_06975 [Colletotrichum graminicola]